MGWGELEGIANRTDFDLKQHAQYSGKPLDYFDDETKERYAPFVIEPSAGVDRSALAFLCDAYDEDIAEGESRTVLRFHPTLAPIKAAILPLSRKENLVKVAREVYNELRKHAMVNYDDTQSIGRRYRRQDEVGTPYCITVDFQSLDDGQVTIRERDSMNQIRVPIKSLPQIILAKLSGEPFLELPYGGQVWKKAAETK
jgi:glycyl-tRNA synthetase